MSNSNSEADIVTNLYNELQHLGLNVRHQQNLPPNFKFKGKKNSRPDLNCDVTDQNQIISNALILIEVKLNPADHLKGVKQLHGYMKNIEYLQEETNVIGLAVSGSGPTRKFDTFLKLQGSNDITDMLIHTPLSSQHYYTNILNHQQTQAALNSTQKDIVDFAKELGDEIRTKLGVDISNFSLLVSAIMLCLHDPSFKLTYSNNNSMSVLLGSMQNTITSLLSRKRVPAHKTQIISQEYAHIWNSTSLNNKNVGNLISIIGKVYSKLYLALNAKNDILGIFYSQFLKYGASNQSNLGIVLTPEHCCEFMVDLAELTVDSKVVDTCCGTGSFLITAMGRMLKMANSNSAKEALIKSEQLMGFELHNKIYTLACANMILRGDGHANLFNNSCLVNANGSPHSERDDIKQILKPNRLIINPPYALNKKGNNPDLDEYEFILQGLDLIQPNGIGVVIVPMSKGIASNRVVQDFKERLIQHHTLEAVFSMPDQLFVDVACVTIVIVIKAHVPHNAKKSTFFGYMKDDGFYTNKSQRVEREDGLWNKIKTEMLDAYWGKQDIPELSVNKVVTHEDEWCAEAYLECDYLDINEIKNASKEFEVYKLLGE